MIDLCSLSAYQYDLPKELIAKRPASKRDASRLMLVNKTTGSIEEIRFHELVDWLDSQDTLIFNNARVIRARLYGQKETGAKIEIFLAKEREKSVWEVLAKPAKKLQPGTKVSFSSDFSCEVKEELVDGRRVVQFHHSGTFDDALASYGHLPLPPYMDREADEADEERYQTIFSKVPGSLAAPTAGLHFTEEMLQQLSHKGVKNTALTLHVGLGTFQPVQTEDIKAHKMHQERCVLSEETVQMLDQTYKKGRQVCVGTTTCRTLETAANDERILIPGDYDSELFIYPGYQFKYVDTLLTNFHLPGSTLLMLVSALGGYELIREAYAKAVEQRFRFYSYGDAMLIY